MLQAASSTTPHKSSAIPSALRSLKSNPERLGSQ